MKIYIVTIEFDMAHLNMAHETAKYEVEAKSHAAARKWGYEQMAQYADYKNVKVSTKEKKEKWDWPNVMKYS